MPIQQIIKVNIPEAELIAEIDNLKRSGYTITNLAVTVYMQYTDINHTVYQRATHYLINATLEAK